MLPQLNADPNNQVDVQQTAFSYDVLGRWVCGSWPEVSGNGGDPFDVVVIGAGMFGGYIADKLYRRGGNLGLRILIVDAGSFLLPTHVQNVPRLGLNGPAEQVVAANAQDPGPQNLVWGHPNQILRSGVLRISGDHLLRWTVQTQTRHILDMGGKEKRASIDNKNPKTQVAAAAVQLVCNVSAKHARADHHDIERIAAVATHFGPRATHPPTEDIVRKGGLLDIDLIIRIRI